MQGNKLSPLSYFSSPLNSFFKHTLTQTGFPRKADSKELAKHYRFEKQIATISNTVLQKSDQATDAIRVERVSLTSSGGFNLMGLMGQTMNTIYTEFILRLDIGYIDSVGTISSSNIYNGC